MVQSKAKTVKQYLDDLPDERRRAISKVRSVVRKNLPKGDRETMNFGMITYEIPLERFPNTYNKQPICYASLAAQKNFNTIYLIGPTPTRSNGSSSRKPSGRAVRRWTWGSRASTR